MGGRLKRSRTCREASLQAPLKPQLESMQADISKNEGWVLESGLLERSRKPSGRKSPVGSNPTPSAHEQPGRILVVQFESIDSNFIKYIYAMDEEA